MKNLEKPLRYGLLAALALLAGCASVEPHPHLMPTPVLFKDPRLDLFPALPPALRSTRLPVFYATTRAPAAANEPGHYVNSAGDGVQLGVADIRLGEPGLSWDQLIASDRSNTFEQARFGAVERVAEFGKAGAAGESERRFIAAIDAQLAKANNKELVLYVHGYRVAFDEVAVQMGSFAHYLGHGAMVTFQWPTGMNFWNYITDCPQARQYIPDIEAMIALLARSSATRINILAYSCGSPLLGAALSRLRARHPGESRADLQRRYRIGNVIFAASDVDLRTFALDYMPPIMALAQQLIAYVSSNDRALGFSGLLAGSSRLGRPDVDDLTPAERKRLAADPRLQVIDVTDVRGAHEMGGMRGHGYWYANDWISSDITLSLRHAIPPERRCLVNRPETPLVWRMPEDYPHCVSERLLAAFPELRKSKQ